MLMKTRNAILWLGQEGPRGHALLIPIVAVVSFAVFVVTMYVNDCPAHDAAAACTLSSLGRLSFQPLNDNPLLGPSAAGLSAMGGISSRKVAHDHQLWRPFTCVWLHASVVHLVVDLVSLLFVGTRLEQEFGPWRIGCIYLLSGIGGSLFSLLFIEDRVSVGSSAALFGLMGAIVSEIVPNWSKHEGKAPTFVTLGIIAVLLFIVGFFPHVGNFSHIGGFVLGALLGYAFFRTDHWSWSYHHQQSSPIIGGSCRAVIPYDVGHKVCMTFLWAALVLVLIVLYLILMILAFKGVNANRHCSWCRNFSCAPSSHWDCGGGGGDGSSGRRIVCQYTISTGSKLLLTCGRDRRRSRIYYGSYSAGAMRQLCAELCR